MDIQFYGANCLSFNYKGTRIVVDDNLDKLGAKNITKAEDVALSTSGEVNAKARIYFNGPGEYEVADISVVGIPARSNMDEADKLSSTMFKLSVDDQNILVTGHIFPELKGSQLEAIGLIDVMFVPVGGNGYTVDPIGALNLIKAIEPKLVVPTHYDDKSLKFPVTQKKLDEALKELSMEPKETVTKLKLKPNDLSDVTQLIILEKN